MSQDLRIAVVCSELDLLAHRVLVLVEAEIMLAHSDAEVDGCRGEQQHDQTAQRAGATPRVHHCDCAPSTMSLTMRLIASRRPPTSSRSAYSPSARSPLRSKSVLP